MEAVKNTSSAVVAKVIITGFHSIQEKIRSAKASSQKNSADGFSIYFSKPGPRIKKILEEAKECGIACVQVNDKKLDEMVAPLNEALRDHRGIVLEIKEKNLDSVKKNSGQNIVDFDVWCKTIDSSAVGTDAAGGNSSTAAENSSTSAATDSARARRTIVAILDRVTDPHNVGAIIRSCDQFGISLVIIPEHKAANDIAENEVIARSSAGSSAWVPVAIVNNLCSAVEKLKEKGFWIYGADAGGDSCKKIDFPEKTAIVMGSEGSGIASLLKKQCDQIVSIPTCGKIDSLNVSVAAGILLYEISSRE